MSDITFETRPTTLALENAVARFARYEPRFFALALMLAAAILPTAFASLVDGRTFLGVDVWQKPLKFEWALVVYLLTLVFFARYLRPEVRSARWYRVYSGVVVAAIVAEMVWIAGAAALGTASHFNESPAGQILYSLMGLGALILTTPPAVYAVQIARNHDTQLAPVVREGVIAGLGLVLPLTLITAGTMAQMGTHFVGGSPSDAGGLHVMGWARDGGDLRVAHFFATHALHIVPLIGLGSAYVPGGESRLTLRLGIALYIAFVGYTFVQALAGQAFLPWLG